MGSGMSSKIRLTGEGPITAFEGACVRSGVCWFWFWSFTVEFFHFELVGGFGCGGGGGCAGSAYFEEKV